MEPGSPPVWPPPPSAEGPPPSAVPSAGDPAPPVRPVSPAGYWIGAAVLVVGVGAAAIWFIVTIVGVVKAPDDFQRIPVPGQRTLVLQQGTWTIYLEGYGTGSDRSSRYYSEPDVTVTSSSGRTVPVSYSGSSTSNYNWNGRAGYSMAEVDLPSSGAYTVSVSGETSGGTVAIGRPLFGSIVGAVLGSMALGFVALLVGVTLLIVTGVRRGRAKRAHAPAYAPYGPYGSYGTPPQPGFGYGPPPGYGYAPPPGPGWGPPPHPGSPQPGSPQASSVAPQAASPPPPPPGWAPPPAQPGPRWSDGPWWPASTESHQGPPPGSPGPPPAPPGSWPGPPAPPPGPPVAPPGPPFAPPDPAAGRPDDGVAETAEQPEGDREPPADHDDPERPGWAAPGSDEGPGRSF